MEDTNPFSLHLWRFVNHVIPIYSNVNIPASSIFETIVLMLGRSPGSKSQHEVQRSHHFSVSRMERSGLSPAKMRAVSALEALICEKGILPVNSSYKIMVG